MFCCFSGKKSQTKAIESNTTKLQKKVNYRKSPNPILEPISERSPEESIFSRNNSKPILGFDGSNTTTKKFENIGITPQLSIKEEEEEENNLP